MIALMSEEELAQYGPVILPADMASVRDPGCHNCEGYRPEPQRSGNLQVDPEIHLPSPGMDVDISYYYNAAATNNGPFGYGRQLSTNLTAQANGTHPIVTLTRANGAVASYQDDGSGAFNAKTPGLLNTLAKDVGNSLWKETTPDGHVTAYPLDTTGQVTSLSFRQDAVGNVQTLSYSAGLLQTIEDAVGRLVSFSYSSGLLSSIQDWAGRRTTFQYDTASASPMNLLTTVIGPTGCQTQYGYTTFHLAGATSDWLLSSIVDPNGFATSYLYDQQRRVTSRSIAGAAPWTYLYQPGFMLTMDPLGNITTQTLGSNYSLGGVKFPTGQGDDITRDAITLQQTSLQNGLGAVWTTLYDGSGNVIGTQDPLG